MKFQQNVFGFSDVLSVTTRILVVGSQRVKQLKSYFTTKL